MRVTSDSIGPEMASTLSALDADWLGVCRRAVGGLAEMLADAPSTAERAVETGTRGSGGDRTLAIDEGVATGVFAQRESLHEQGYRFAAISEEGRMIGCRAPVVRGVIDPI